MLNIIFGECKDVIYNTSVFFKNVYEKEWLNEEQTRESGSWYHSSNFSFGWCKDPYFDKSYFR